MSEATDEARGWMGRSRKCPFVSDRAGWYMAAAQASAMTAIAEALERLVELSTVPLEEQARVAVAGRLGREENAARLSVAVKAHLDQQDKPASEVPDGATPVSSSGCGFTLRFPNTKFGKQMSEDYERLIKSLRDRDARWASSILDEIGKPHELADAEEEQPQ